MLIETLMILALQTPDHPKALTPTVAREYVMERASRAGYNSRERACLDELVHRESRWRNVKNPESSAFGYFQILRLPEDTTLPKQWERFHRYIQHRYGGICEALMHHNRRGWY